MDTLPRNIRLTIQYDGTRYCGWQRQTNALSVQQVLEEALEAVNGAPVRLRAAGRTDAGVHAAGQVANFHTASPHPPRAFLRAANDALPHDVAVIEAAEAPPEFDARGDARLRWYRYRLVCGPVRPVLERAFAAYCPYRLDRRKALKAVSLFEGRRDFAGFRSIVCGAKRTVLDMRDAALEIDGPRWTFDFRSRSFLQNMIRIMVGAAIEAGRGKIPLEAIEAALSTGKRDPRIPTAPAHGLTLMAVGYPLNFLD